MSNIKPKIKSNDKDKFQVPKKTTITEGKEGVSFIIGKSDKAIIKEEESKKQ